MMLSLVQVCPCHPLFQINYIATLKYWILDINGFYICSTEGALIFTNKCEIW